MGVDFTGRCHVLFNRVVESLLCSLHEGPVLQCKNYLLESQYFRKFQGLGLNAHLVAFSVEVQSKWRPKQIKYRSSLYLFVTSLVLVPTSNMCLHLRLYLQNVYEIRTKHFVWMKVNVNLWMKSIRTCQFHSRTRFEKEC